MPFTVSANVLRVILVVLLATSIDYPARTQPPVKSNIQRSLENVDTLRVDLSKHVVLSISAVSKDTLEVTSLQRGEYTDALVLNLSEHSRSVTLQDLVSPGFAYPQDKLSAHKVNDNEVHLQIPEHVFLDLSLRSGDVVLKGNFQGLYLELMAGVSHIHTDTAAVIKTLTADVHLKTSLPLDCHSRKGNCPESQNNLVADPPVIKVESVYGDVVMRNR